MRKISVSTISIMLFFVFYGNASAVQKTHVVHKNGETSCTTGDFYYNSIQSAVEAAGPVDTVIICPASDSDPYVENVISYKGRYDSKQGISIQAYDPDPTKTVVQAADPNQHVFYFAGGGLHNLLISGLTIKGATGGVVNPNDPNDTSGYCKICIPGSPCFVDTQPYCSGIRIFCTENGYIGNNYITENNHGIIIKDTAPDWMFLMNITSNYIFDNRVGVRLQYGNNNFLFRNYIYNNNDTSGNGIGIHLLDTWSNEFSNNLIESNDISLKFERVIYDVSNNLFYGNDVINTPGVSAISENLDHCLNQWYKRLKPTETNGNYWTNVPQPTDCYDSFSSASRVTLTNIWVSSLSAPSTASQGQTISVADTTTNATAIPVNVSTTTAFYLSSDNKWSGGDTYLSARTVSPMGPLLSNDGNTQITIPAGTATGNYYIISYADRYNVVCETDEQPNCNNFYWANNAKKSVPISITESSPIPDWPYRQQITINSSMTTANLSSYSLLVKITDQANPLFANAQLDGDDILFTASDGTTQLDHEIELYQSTGTEKELDVWVRIPVLSSASDTIIYMYYGNNTAANQENIEAVWDGNHIMVQHLNEITGQHLDSTAYNNDSTEIVVAAQGTAGKIGGADEFSTNNYITIPDKGVDSPIDLSGSGSITLSAWVYARGPGENPGNQWGILDKSDSGGGYTLRGDGWNCTAYGDYTVIGTRSGNWSGICGTANDITQNSWDHIAYVFDSTTSDHYIYINGVLDASGNMTASALDSSNDLHIGEWLTRSIDGFIDEVRISNSARTSSWINTSYNNQNSPDTYLTFGTEETY